jgi:hypothetical protein
MAARYWVSGGNGSWTSTTNWSTTSGGASGASVPTGSDDAYFDANGNSNATLSTARNLLSLNIDSGYTSTITHNAVLTINAGGALNLSNNYTIAGTSELLLQQNVTITSNGKTWPNNLRFGSTGTRTLVGDFTIGGTLILPATSYTLNATTNEVLYVNGITNSGGLSGTAIVEINSGTWQDSATIGAIQTNLRINGNVTIGSTVTYKTGTLTYVSGTVDTTTNSSTLILSDGAILDTNGISWYNITHSAVSGAVFTLNSLLTVTNNFTMLAGAAETFAGTSGFIVSNLINNSISAVTITLREGETYTITTSFQCYKSRHDSSVLFTSSSGTVKANLVLVNPSLCNVLAGFTRIDASGGRTINTFNGVLTGCENIRAFNDLQTVGSPL